MIDVRDDAPFFRFQLSDRPMLACFLELAAALGIDPTNMPDTRRLPEEDWAIRGGGHDRDVLPPVDPDPADVF